MSDFLAGAGVLLAAAMAAGAILLPPGRLRSAAMLTALLLFPALILGDQWHSRAIVDLRDNAFRLLGLGALGLLASGALAFAFRRRPLLLPLAIVFALPFRIPLDSGGDTYNLLVPLYLVIAGGVLSTLWSSWRSWRPASATGGADVEGPRTDAPRPPAGPSTAVTGPVAGGARWLPRTLAAVVILYALQSVYSEDFSKALQNLCFFFVPFSLVFALLRGVEWDRRLLVAVLWVVGLEAVAFVLLGTVEFFSRELLWNDQVIRSNEFHTYFRVNSVFWDPNIYGRYLALVAVTAMSALLWARDRRDLALASALVAILWIGLVQTYSESSYISLLAGLAMLAALRWNWRWTLAAVAIAGLGMLGIVAASGKLRLNTITSGRANLVSGGADLFRERPLWGYGSGSFQAAYRQHHDNEGAPVTISHTEPVTVAAEQGLLGLALYAALVLVALWTMGAGIWTAASERGPPWRRAGRAAILATFVALLVHTMAYAGFYEDPITWLLLAAATAMASGAASPSGAASSGEGRPRS